MGIQTILVVDDDEHVLAAHRRFRERTVVTASSAAAALAASRKTRVDLALVDLRIGLDSGLDLMCELKRIQPELVVAIVSGYLSVETAVAATRAGADLVKFKPVTIRDILNILERAPEPVEIETPTLARAEWEHVQRVLADTNGNVSEAARRLGIFRTSLQRKLKRLAPRA